jgi:hypothetical protein
MILVYTIDETECRRNEMLLWLLACGDEPKSEPEVQAPSVVDVSAEIQSYLESSGAPALGTARIQGDFVTEMGDGWCSKY